jgi:transposase
MSKIYRVCLGTEERQYLERFVNTGTAKARKITRARILLLADEGPEGPAKNDEQIVESLGVCFRTIAKTRECFAEGGVQSALDDRPRPGQPPKLSGRDEAMITAVACSDPPSGRGRWTLRLLADKLVELSMVDSISHETVRKVLKKTISSRGFANNGVSAR